MGFEQEFEKWKQEYLGPYCMEKCDTTCCDMRNVSLYVSREELVKLFGPDAADVQGVKKDGASGMYFLDTGDYCPKFDSHTRKCVDYNNRSKSCREFPFLAEKDSILIKSGCPFGKGDRGYKELAELASRHGKVIIQRRGR